MGRYSVVLFDYGGTLVDFYRRDQFPEVLWEALSEASTILFQNEETMPPDTDIWDRVSREDRERSDHRVRPLEERLARIFKTDHSHRLQAAATAFTQVIRGHGVAIPGGRAMLTDLTEQGYRLGLVSNTPWGCPGKEWLRDLDDRGLRVLFEHVISCRDVGYRKPAPVVYRHALDIFDAQPGDCLFVGDDPLWDVHGPQSIGMDALLFDRQGTGQLSASVRTLSDVVAYLDGRCMPSING